MHQLEFNSEAWLSEPLEHGIKSSTVKSISYRNEYISSNGQLKISLSWEFLAFFCESVPLGNIGTKNLKASLPDNGDQLVLENESIQCEIHLESKDDAKSWLTAINTIIALNYVDLPTEAIDSARGIVAHVINFYFLSISSAPTLINRFSSLCIDFFRGILIEDAKKRNCAIGQSLELVNAQLAEMIEFYEQTFEIPNYLFDECKTLIQTLADLRHAPEDQGEGAVAGEDVHSGCPPGAASLEQDLDDLRLGQPASSGAPLVGTGIAYAQLSDHMQTAMKTTCDLLQAIIAAYKKDDREQFHALTVEVHNEFLTIDDLTKQLIDGSASKCLNNAVLVRVQSFRHAWADAIQLLVTSLFSDHKNATYDLYLKDCLGLLSDKMEAARLEMQPTVAAIYRFCAEHKELMGTISFFKSAFAKSLHMHSLNPTVSWIVNTLISNVIEVYVDFFCIRECEIMEGEPGPSSPKAAAAAADTGHKKRILHEATYIYQLANEWRNEVQACPDTYRNTIYEIITYAKTFIHKTALLMEPRVAASPLKTTFSALLGQLHQNLLPLVQVVSVSPISKSPSSREIFLDASPAHEPIDRTSPIGASPLSKIASYNANIKRPRASGDQFVYVPHWPPPPDDARINDDVAAATPEDGGRCTRALYHLKNTKHLPPLSAPPTINIWDEPQPAIEVEAPFVQNPPSCGDVASAPLPATRSHSHLKAAAPNARLSGSSSLPALRSLSKPPKTRIVPQTLNSLVTLLTHHDVVDEDFSKCFLIMYETFTSPEQLWIKLVERYNVPAERDLPPKIVSAVKLRVINFVAKWLTADRARIGEDLALHIAYFIRQVIGTEFPRLKERLIERLRAEDDDAAHPPRAEIPTYLQALCDGRARILMTYDAAIRGLTAATMPRLDAEILRDQFSPAVFAEQLTLIDHALFTQVPGPQLLTKKPSENPAIHAIIRHFNMISDWAATTVLRHQSLANRVKALSKLLGVVEVACRLNNFNLGMAVSCGLNQTPVHRCKMTLAALTRRDRQILATHSDLFSAQSSYRNYRARLSASIPPIVPYLGIFITDLIYIDEGNKNDFDGDINFSKRLLVFKVVSQIEQMQAVSYDIVPRPDVLALFSAFQYLSHDDAYRLSKYIEPSERTVSSGDLRRGTDH